MDSSAQPFLTRNEFLIRRLHSLSGLIPVGAYVVVHLVTNASVVNGEGTYQGGVYQIHSLGRLLPVVEWVFIFLPILFHAIVGVAIVAGGMPNSHQYRYGPNIRYTMQRYTGMIAFAFIVLHVGHMHGWFHNESWLNDVVRPMGGAKFRAYNATSTAGEALQAWSAVLLYIVGVVATVFHLANGIWTMGITWGAWTSEKAQARAAAICALFGIGLASIGMTGLFGLRAAVDTPQKMQSVRETEQKMLQQKIEAGLDPDPHKLADPPDHDGDGE
ncbi:succinate dehydrogenase cytochrome b558 subunit [Pirellulales bacterium]|nr:succinate dehydrogenase cytochrome b558 subunit [Pirellulales bacterium]